MQYTSIAASQLKINGTLLTRKDFSSDTALETALKAVGPHDFSKKTIGNSTHFRSKKCGIEIEYSKGQIQTLFLYLTEKDYGCYDGPLPYGIKQNCKFQELVWSFGEPSSKKGGKNIVIHVVYEWLGMEVAFHTTDWNHKDAVLSYITLFKPTEKQQKCSMCMKVAKDRCPNCPYILYCSEACCNKFSGNHQKHCQKKQ